MANLTLQEAHQFMAELIAAGNHAYLPIFKRLEEELEKQSQEQSLIDRARLMAAQKNPTLVSQAAFCSKLGPAP